MAFMCIAATRTSIASSLSRAAMRLDAHATAEGVSVVKSGDFYAYFMQGRCPTTMLLLSFSRKYEGYGWV